VQGAIGAPRVQAVHFSMFPISKMMEAWDAQEEKALKRLQAFEDNESGYRAEQVQSPQTIGYPLTDSPAGQAAWLYEKYEQWTRHDGDPEHPLSRDEMLDNITLYWLTGTAASSARIYWQSSRSVTEHKTAVPVGYSQFPRDIHEISQRWVQERYPMLVHYDELTKGGHFAVWEQPELFALKLSVSFRHSR
jgi:epoxide hydrolase